MNLVELIQDQITGEVTNKLSSLIGGSESQTRSAVGAAVPSLLSALTGLASGGSSGADKLASALGKFDAGSIGKIAGMLTQQPNQALDQGGSLLGSLFGEGAIGGIANAIARFTGLDAAMTKKLLAYLAPLVLGSIAGQFKGKSITAQGLTSLFTDQKANIADALPSGLSLAGIPGLSQVETAARNVGATAQRAANTAYRAADSAQNTGSSLLKTLLPLAALALLAFLAWQFFRGRQPVGAPAEVARSTTPQTAHRPVTESTAALPDAAQIGRNLTSVFTTATETLGGITDAALAEAAVPKLEELSTKIDAIKALWDKLPQAARATISNIAGDNLGKLKDLIATVLTIPGVRQHVEPLLDDIVTKLTAFGGAA